MAVDLERPGHCEFSAPVVVFALRREAAPFLRMVKRDRLPARVCVSGMGREAARRTAERACAGEPAPRLVIAAGYCGALQPDLRVGEVIVTADVIDVHGSFAPPGPRPDDGRVLTMDRVIGDPAEKRLLYCDHAANVVDMESAGVAEVSRGFNVPFLAVRAVSDTADTALSPRLAALLSGGRVSPWRAAAAVFRQPSLLGEFRRLARDTRRASEKLADVLRQVITRWEPGFEPRSGGSD